MSILKNYPLKHVDGQMVSEMVITINLLGSPLREIKEEIGRKANANRGFLFIRMQNNPEPVRVGTYSFRELLEKHGKQLENGDHVFSWGSP